MLLIMFSVASNLTRWNFESPSKCKSFIDALGELEPLITFFRLFLPTGYSFHNTGNYTLSIYFYSFTLVFDNQKVVAIISYKYLFVIKFCILLGREIHLF